MRILLSEEEKITLFNYLKKKYKAKSLKELSQKLSVSFKTLQNWRYEKRRYLPSTIIPKNINLQLIDRKSDNWGQIKGGKETYKILIKKYGIEEIRRRQLKGGKISSLRRDRQAKENFKLDLNDPLFLEFYGALLGDGWLSSLSYKYKVKKNLWWVGISGHLKLDREYLMFLRDIINKLFKRKVVIKYRKRWNSMEIILCHKHLILFMNKKLGFPIGKKINLKINNRFLREWDKIKHIIRGVFDTDGCFYLDKTPVGNPYPCIMIKMKAPILIKQIYKSLIFRGFKVRYKELKNGQVRVDLRGRKQLDKWMKEIGSSNPKHLNKIKALVAQQDSAAAS